MEATGYSGSGVVVLAHDDNVSWTGQVLVAVQQFVIESGYYVQRMMPHLHEYHLDDNPELRSCNLIVTRDRTASIPAAGSSALSPERLANFYGRDQPLQVHYVRSVKTLDYGVAPETEYFLERLGESDGTTH